MDGEEGIATPTLNLIARVRARDPGLHRDAVRDHLKLVDVGAGTATPRVLDHDRDPCPTRALLHQDADALPRPHLALPPIHRPAVAEGATLLRALLHVLLLALVHHHVVVALLVALSVFRLRHLVRDLRLGEGGGVLALGGVFRARDRGARLGGVVEVGGRRRRHNGRGVDGGVVVVRGVGARLGEMDAGTETGEMSLIE